MFGLISLFSTTCLGIVLLLACAVTAHFNGVAQVVDPIEARLRTMVPMFCFVGGLITLTFSVSALVQLRPWRGPAPWKRAWLDICPVILPLQSLAFVVPVVLAAIAVYIPQMLGRPTHPVNQQTYVAFFHRFPWSVAIACLLTAVAWRTWALSCRRHRELTKLEAAGRRLCAQCGYILDGLPTTAGRCPDCGSPWPEDK